MFSLRYNYAKITKFPLVAGAHTFCSMGILLETQIFGKNGLAI